MALKRNLFIMFFIVPTSCESAFMAVQFEPTSTGYIRPFKFTENHFSSYVAFIISIILNLFQQ